MKKLQEYTNQAARLAYTNQTDDAQQNYQSERNKAAKQSRKVPYSGSTNRQYQTASSGNQQSANPLNQQANTSLGRVNPSLLNIAPDNVKKRLLMNRLYDTGVSNIPLPSVERPLEKKASARPYSAKMGKKQKDPTSPVKKRLQDMNNSFNVNETYLTNHPGNFTNILNNDTSYTYLQKDNSFIDPYPRSRGIAAANLGVGSGLNMSASDIQILQGPNPYIQDISHSQLPSINNQNSRGKSALNLVSKTNMNQQTFYNSNNNNLNQTRDYQNYSSIQHQNYSHTTHSITGITTMTPLRPSQSTQRKTLHKDFITAKLMMSKPKIDYEPLKQVQQEKMTKIKDILYKQQIQQQIQQSENMQRDPSLIQFNDLSTFSQKKFERARSKYLLDKLTGKLNNPDYFLQLSRSIAEQNGVDTDEFLAQLNNKSTLENQKQMSRINILNNNLTIDDQDNTQLLQKDFQHKPEFEKQVTNSQTKIKKTWSELDKYIELLLDSKQTDQSVFVYLNPNSNGNPYDLQVIQYHDRNESKYYTLSAKGITLYLNESPLEFITLGDWLIERDSYNHIKELSFFKKFKRWKFLRMWRKNILSHKRAKARRMLEEKLFILDDIFRPKLLNHKTFCTEMQKMRFIDISKSLDCVAIEDFASLQQKQKTLVSEKIQSYSDKCRVNVKQAIDNMIHDLRDRIISELALDEEQRKNNPQSTLNQVNSTAAAMKRKKSNSVFENLGFPDHMTYGHRSNLRKECSRFLRFAYLIDFLAMESLSQIYIDSVKEIIAKLQRLDESNNSTLTEHDMYQHKGMEPMFKVQIIFDPENDIPSTEIVLVKPLDFKLPPHGNSKDEDFDPTVHLELEPEKKEGEEDEDDEDLNDIDIADLSFDSDGKPKRKGPKIMKQVAPTLFQRWLFIDPSKDEILTMLQNVLAQGLESLQVFERWSKHDELTPYANALEEWDDMVGDDWEAPEKNYLNPYDWIKEDELYANQNIIIEQILDSAFIKAQDFLEGMQPYLHIYWTNERIIFDLLIDERLRQPTDMLIFTTKLFKLQKEKFEEIPQVAFRGLLKLDNSKSRDFLLPSPKKCLSKIEGVVPDIIRKRTDEMRRWLTASIKSLSKTTATVEDFVEQSNSLNRVQEQFQDIRDKVDLYGQYYNIFHEYLITFKKEDKESHNEAVTDISKLNNLIASVDSSQNSNLDIFRKSLDEQIPKLNQQINDCLAQTEEDIFLSNKVSMYDILRKLDTLEATFKELESTATKYNNYQEVLQVQATSFENLETLREQLTLRCLMWRSLREWEERTEGWIKEKFANINAKEIQAKADLFSKICNRVEKNLPPNPIAQRLKQMVDTFKAAMPVVVALRNENLKQEHWKEIKDFIGQDFNVEDANFTLESLIKLNAQQYQEEIQGVSAQATAEASLRAQMAVIEEVWKKLDFKSKVYKEGAKDTSYILEEIDDIYTTLDESMASVNTILGSRFVKPLRTDAELWKKNLQLLSKILDNWIFLQKQWMYLENIFTAGDIRKQLLNEAQKFDHVDKQFKQLMVRVHKSPNVMKTLKQNNNLNENLMVYNETLDEIQKQLEKYLETKRQAFPRFYFLSNDELLEILAKSNDLEVIQQNLRTCFDNIMRLEIKDGVDIIAMMSGEGEKIQLSKVVKARNQVETWLLMVQIVMVETIHKIMKAGLQDYSNTANIERKSWVMKQPGQVVSTISQVLWCSSSESYINEMMDNPFALQDWYQVNIMQLTQLIDLVRGNLDSVRRKIIVALITCDVHARDIVENLMKEQVQSINDFSWQQQLRYYWDEEKDQCIVKQVNAIFQYGYEYMGATSRLVITPLTDRCWITITGALNIKLGAAPAGPAGTGKTESTKDLAKGLGMQCVVFNCSEQITYVMMGRLFSGLAQTGAWACLDEFNRIDIEVLSVIAQQLMTIRRALIAYEEQQTFLFEDNYIPLIPTCGVFITMNPGYAGRTELPDNLKVLFRPVSMMIPNYRLIAEIMLFAEGFLNARPLSQKMVQLYKLSSEQLSQQDHYDFGMRAVKSVLVMAGALKRAQKDLEEDIVLIRAMRDSNVPKFLKDDLPLFQALIQDLFPSAEIPDVSFEELESQIKETIEKRGLQPVPAFIKKVVQLFDTFDVRFGVMIVGPTGGGKTTCYDVLADSMGYLRKDKHSKDSRYQVVRKEVLNPKSITMGELYGEVNPISQEWKDGLASKIMREAALESKDDKTWVVFDGPVDALWIENMNTVLDDNMTLCLANGQRIKLRFQMRMLFEVQDLAVASPATVSRCGMVYMTPEELGWQPYIQSWIPRIYQDDSILSEEHKTFLLSLFITTVEPAFEKIRTLKLVEYIKTVEIQRVASICNFLEVLLQPQYGFKGDKEEKKKNLPFYFAFAYIWGIGGGLDSFGQERFDDVVREQFKACSIPPNNTVFDYYLETKKEVRFQPWTNKIEEFQYEKDMPFFQMLVPTVDTQRSSYCLEILLEKEKPALFTGITGVGKSVIILNLLSSIQEGKSINPVFLNFSAQTSSIRTQKTIEDKIERKRKGLYGAPPGKKLAIFVDDVNMPSVEKYGAQPPIELLRLFVDRKGLYDRDTLEWKRVEDATVIAAGARPGGGRNDLTLRFTRHFNVFNIPEGSRQTLQRIFGSILNGFLKAGFSDSIQKLGDGAVMATIEVYQRIIEEKRPTPAKFHYLFNLRDVSKVFQGVLMTKPVSVSSAEVFAKLWMHECLRVFHDRLINEEDKLWFTKMLAESSNVYFRVRFEHDDLFVNGKLLFGDLLKLDSTKNYEEIKDQNKLKSTLLEFLEDYNISATRKMNLVFFEDAIEHIIRISRVLRQPRGNMMLIGVGGSGKQSLTKLSCHMLGYKGRQVEITKNFGTEQFRDFLKELMFGSGIDGQQICLVLTDTQIVKETFLEDINNLLNTGDIPNLFLQEDYDKIINSVRPIVIEMKRVDTQDNILTTFNERVREKLHITLCMSPVGDSLRVRCRMFPSLVNCCTLNWFDRWPEQALLYVSSEFLKEVEVQNDVKRNLAEMCMMIHTTVEEKAQEFYEKLRRKVYTTPKSYLDLIHLYVTSLEQKREESMKNKRRLAIGLQKLKDTNTNIADFKIKIEELQPQLKAKNEQIMEALVQVEKDSKIANEVERVASEEAKIVNAKKMEAQAIAEDAERDLSAAKPELEAAKQAVSNLDKASIVEIKSMPNPPTAVNMVMQSIMLLLGEKQDWASIRSQLNDTNGFIDRLKNFDVMKYPESTFEKCRKNFLSKPEFDISEVRKKSVAASFMAMWVKAVNSYQKVVKVVEPKQRRYNEVKANLDQAESELQVKMAEVQKVRDKVASLQQKCEEMENEKQRLAEEMDRCEKRMGRAEKLLVLLLDEGIRWKDTVEKMDIEMEKLVGNVFISCGCISYYGAFTGLYREQMVKLWRDECVKRRIPISEDFNITKVMGNPVVIRDWNHKGLPTDTVSIENGILCTQGSRWPLLIDPQQQGNKWIKNLEKQNELFILRQTTPNIQRTLGMATSSGKPVLIEDIEEFIDPGLDPILLKSAYKTEGGIMQIRIGDQVYDYDDKNFRFFITTKMPNPHYLPEIFIKLTIINFTVTFMGLEDQLMGDVVVQEKPEVEKKRDEIVVSMDKDKNTLVSIEDSILKLLAESTEEQILDQDDLIIILENSKKTSADITKRLGDAAIVEEQINETRNQYRTVATRGSILYFVIADLAGIDPMYQYSLAYVKRLFNSAIQKSPQQPTLQERLDVLINRITETLYLNVSRGLFVAHKVLFSYLICTSINRNSQKINELLWGILLRGAGVFNKQQQPENPSPTMITQIGWDLAYYLQVILPSKFDKFTDHIIENISIWEDYCTTNDPQQEPLPDPWNDTLDQFEKQLILKVFRPEKLMFAFTDYVRDELGRMYIENQAVTMDTIFQDSDRKTPVIFILSTGADPTTSLYKFARDQNFDNKIQGISLGQGQGIKAEKLIDMAKDRGEWILLQNCHLAKSWMPSLENIVQVLQEEAVHQDFRLFLTSMPAEYFPVSVLQNGVKLTTEPPRGLRANLMKSFQEMNIEQFQNARKPREWQKLVFGLSFFHAIIQERRKFGPLGWNIRYEFNDSDLETSNTNLAMFLEEQDEIPWEALLYVTGHINYGGRVTDDWDRVCLISILKKYYTPDILEDGYMLSQSGTYYVPEVGTLQSFKNYIADLPIIDSPEVFGLHENANITYQSQESEKIIQTILSIQPRVTSGAGGKSQDDIVMELAIELENQLPPLLDRANAKKDLFKTNEKGLMESLSTVLLQEVARFNRLLSVMRSSLEELQKAINGLVVMSSELDSMYLSMLNSQVPANWEKVAYPSLKPLMSWFRDLIERVEFMNLWLTQGQPPCFWISGFFFPQGFMTGVLQTHSRKHRVAIDQLNFSFKVLDSEYDQLSDPPKDGVFIYGLYMDGARWDRQERAIEDQYPGEMYCSMPVILFKPVENYEINQEDYQCPIYKTSVRAGVLSTTGQSTNYILAVDLPTRETPSYWTLKGAALLCQLND